MCMSCVDQLISKGYELAFSRSRAVVFDSKHWEDVQYQCFPGGCLLLFFPKAQSFKRLKIKFTVSINAFGRNPLGTYYCAAGFAIERLVVWVFDPISKIAEMLNTLMLIMILIQIMTTLIG